MLLSEEDVEHAQSDDRGELHLTVKMHHLLDERDKSYRSIDHPLFEPFHRGEDPPPSFVAVDCLLRGLIQEVSTIVGFHHCGRSRKASKE